MKSKKSIIILSVLLILSLSLILLLSYAIVGIDNKWKSAYNKNDMEWCEISNRDNEVINDMVEQLIYYDEDYRDMPYMVDLNCFS